MRTTYPQAKIHLVIAPAFARKVKKSRLWQAAQAAFESTGKGPGGELTLVITDDAQVQALNYAYRGVDAPTDVLSFGHASATQGFVSSPEATGYLGDIVISYPRALDQAETYGHPIDEELALLVVHGVLHLLGFDHEQSSDKEAMWRLQSAALTQLGIDWQP